MVRAWLVAALLLSVVAFAQGDAGEAASALLDPQVPVSEPPELLKEEISLGWSLVQTFVVLGLVVALAWLTLNVGLRRLMGLAPAGRRGIVSVVERVPLDQKRALYVVRAGGEVLLLGASELSVNVITKLDASVLDVPVATSTPQLSPLLQKLMGKKNDPPPPTGTS